MTITDKVFTKNPQFVQREVAGEFLLVPIQRQLTDVNSLYVLNETGAAVWKRIDGCRSVGEIQDQLASEYEIAEPQLSSDLAVLFNDLLSIKAIQEIAQ